MTLGWDAGWDDARRARDPDGALAPVRIAAEHRGAYHGLDAAGALAWVELPGVAFHRAADKRELPTVGDWVLVERWADAVAERGAAVVREVLPRRSLLVRKAAGDAVAPQPLAANVDLGIVMTSANADLVPARLDRYVGLLRDGGIEPVIVVSKIDLASDADALLAAARAVHPDVLAASVVTGAGIDAVRARVGPGRTCVLLGSSGVGKSTLLNAVAGAAQDTRGIRADERGRHTTTRRELFVAEDGSLWIDTPGMRELAQYIEDDEEQAAFDDIAELAASCRFRDCQHRDEPGCAVRGAVAPARLASFHKLAAERTVTAKKIAEAPRKRKPKPPPSE